MKLGKSFKRYAANYTFLNKCSFIFFFGKSYISVHAWFICSDRNWILCMPAGKNILKEFSQSTCRMIQSFVIDLNQKVHADMFFV